MKATAGGKAKFQSSEGEAPSEPAEHRLTGRFALPESCKAI